MTITAVVFDIGNVLIEWQPERFYDRVIGAQQRVAFFATVPILAMNDRVDAGADMRAEVAALGQTYPDWAGEIAMWQDRWAEMAAPAIDHSVRLLRALRRAGHPVFALSNFGVSTFRMAEREYPFLEEFDLRFVSGELGMMKPDAAIYARLEADSGLAPATLLFTDDRADNIAAAAARGWQTHLFDGAQGFAARLVAEGLLTQDDAQ